MILNNSRGDSSPFKTSTQCFFSLRDIEDEIYKEHLTVYLIQI